jgi:hypothetical protein
VSYGVGGCECWGYWRMSRVREKSTMVHCFTVPPTTDAQNHALHFLRFLRIHPRILITYTHRHDGSIRTHQAIPLHLKTIRHPRSPPPHTSALISHRPHSPRLHTHQAVFHDPRDKARQVCLVHEILGTHNTGREEAFGRGEDAGGD